MSFPEILNLNYMIESLQQAEVTVSGDETCTVIETDTAPLISNHDDGRTPLGLLWDI